MKRSRVLIVLLTLSVALNVWFGWRALDWWLGFPSVCEPHRVGVLTRPVEVGVFGEPEGGPVLTLPAGLSVGDVMSPNPIGEFEPHRFAIIVTSDRDGLVDYSVPRGRLHPFGPVYSARRP